MKPHELTAIKVIHGEQTSDVRDVGAASDIRTRLGGWRLSAVGWLIQRPSHQRAVESRGLRFLARQDGARIKDPAIAEILAPTEPIHPYGTKRPSLEQNFFDIFNQSNMILVDLRKTPIENVTRGGVETTAGGYDLDVLVLATGFDAVTGGLTRIDIRGTDGRTLREKWAEGVRAHLGMASAGYPNLLFVYGPHSLNAFANGPTAAELQGKRVHVRRRNWARFEATVPAELAWCAKVFEAVDATLFPRADSWYFGANIPGKRREMLSYAGESAEKGYEGFAIS